MKNFFSFLVFMVFFMCGIYITQHSWNGFTYLSANHLNNAQRDPAAIKKVFDFSNLEGNALEFASKNRLLEDAKLVKGNGQLGIELGHFVTKTPEGKKVLACQEYDTVIMHFEADGAAYSGERPSMVVEAGCSVSQDINRIAPIWIPVGRLLEEEPGEFEISYDLNGQSVRFTFTNLFDEWPHEWVLRDLSLKNRSGSEVYVSPREVKDIREKPLILHW